MGKKTGETGEKGHNADKPSEIPAKGWKEIGSRVISQLKVDHVQIVSAGVGFYFFMAIFPTIVAALSIYGLLLDPAQIQEHVNGLAQFLPGEAYEIIESVMEPIVSKDDQTLGWGLLFSILLSLWSANQGTNALFEGINIAYNEEDDRNFFKKTGMTLLFTLGGIILGLLSLVIVILFPALIDHIHLGTTVETVLGWTRWILLAFIIVFGLGVLYKKAPDRDNPEMKWVSWGSVIATVLWILGSMLFSWYVNNFGSYDDMYGSFASVIIMLLWLFLTSFIILLGAEINSEMEHQTAKDTTVGPDEPMGQRGGYHADHVAGKK